MRTYYNPETGDTAKIIYMLLFVRHKQWVDYLKKGHLMSVGDVRTKFNFTQPIRTAEVINKRAGRTVIKQVNAVHLGKTTTLFKYIGEGK